MCKKNCSLKNTKNQHISKFDSGNLIKWIDMYTELFISVTQTVIHLSKLIPHTFVNSKHPNEQPLTGLTSFTKLV